MTSGPPETPYKSRPGLVRVLRAMAYSWAGLRAAFRHEAALRQEVAVGLPLMLAAPWLAPSRGAALAMVASIALVWIVELLNSALEALADSVSVEHNPLLGRAKDIGSAAVFLSISLAVGVWAVLLWP
jgi:diacylglycerol kinase (ATP)